MADTFHLGVVADPEPGHERFEGWLSIPYLGIDGDGVEQVYMIRFRCLEGHSCKDYGHGKYQTVKGERARMFNTRAVKLASTDMHITEGELDAIILNQLGYPAVAMPGATQWRWHHAKIMAGFTRVFLWGDGDAAGAEFNLEVEKTLRGAARPVHLPQGMDVNDVYLARGADGVADLFSRAAV